MNNNKKILIVDDEPDTTDFLTMLFDDQGYNVISTTSPDSVIELIRAEKPDMVTLDILMPNKTGVKLYRELREIEEFADLPIALISGVNPADYLSTNGGGSTDSNGLHHTDAFIEKPIDSAKLLDIVGKLLNTDL